MTALALQGVDHIHLYAPDRDQAAAWYADAFGFEVIPAFAFWAENPKGPLTIADPSGGVHLAIFARPTPKPFSIAFSADADGYRAWRARLTECDITLREADHGLCASLYFEDPFGNELEITTPDVRVLKDGAS